MTVSFQECFRESIKAVDSNFSFLCLVRLYKTDICILSPLLISVTFKLDNKKGLDIALQLHRDRKPTYLLFCPPPQDIEGLCNWFSKFTEYFATDNFYQQRITTQTKSFAYQNIVIKNWVLYHPGPYLGYFGLQGQTPHTFTGVSSILTKFLVERFFFSSYTEGFL